MGEKSAVAELQGIITKEELKELIAQVIKEHQCVLNSETVELLNDQENREVLRTIAKGLTPNSASMLARFGRIIDQVEFSLGKFILRSMILGTVGIIIWMAFEKSGVRIVK